MSTNSMLNNYYLKNDNNDNDNDNGNNSKSKSSKQHSYKTHKNFNHTHVGSIIGRHNPIISPIKSTFTKHKNELKNIERLLKFMESLERNNVITFCDSKIILLYIITYFDRLLSGNRKETLMAAKSIKATSTKTLVIQSLAKDGLKFHNKVNQNTQKLSKFDTKFIYNVLELVKYLATEFKKYFPFSTYRRMRIDPCSDQDLKSYLNLPDNKSKYKILFGVTNDDNYNIIVDNIYDIFDKNEVYHMLKSNPFETDIISNSSRSISTKSISKKQNRSSKKKKQQ